MDLIYTRCRFNLNNAAFSKIWRPESTNEDCNHAGFLCKTWYNMLYQCIMLTSGFYKNGLLFQHFSQMENHHQLERKCQSQSYSSHICAFITPLESCRYIYLIGGELYGKKKMGRSTTVHSLLTYGQRGTLGVPYTYTCVSVHIQPIWSEWKFSKSYTIYNNFEILIL